MPVDKLMDHIMTQQGITTSNAECQKNWEEDNLELTIPDRIAAKDLDRYQSRTTGMRVNERKLCRLARLGSARCVNKS
jgi:hypothetical protein